MSRRADAKVKDSKRERHYSQVASRTSALCAGPRGMKRIEVTGNPGVIVVLSARTWRRDPSLTEKTLSVGRAKSGAQDAGQCTRNGCYVPQHNNGLPEEIVFLIP